MLERATESRGDDSLIGAILADRYRVERLLGRGGMGAVYLAEHVHMKKAVALKVLHRDMTRLGELVTRFEREAVAAGRVEHPNVAAASDFGRLEDGSFYLVLEYVDGRSLSELLKEGPLQVDRALAITRQIAAGLSAAHAVSIVHRDLKPDNVMLIGQSAGSERVKILDFGIAHVTVADLGDEPITRLGSIMGTAAYMAPEQAIGQAVDARTDLYSLGIILHEMIAGRPPFEGEEAAQVMAKQLTQPPPPLPGGTPAEVAALVSKMMQKSPADRPADAAAVIEEIDRILNRTGAPVSPPGGRRPQTGPVSAIPTAHSVRIAAPAASVGARSSGEPVSVRAATVLDVGPQSTDGERSRKGLWGLAAVAVIVVFGGFALFSGRGEAEPEAAAPSAVPSAPAPPPPRTASTAASTTRTEGPGTRAALPGTGTASASERVRERNESSSSTTTERDGNTVTRTTKSSSSTSRESVKEQRSVSKKKRRTGPGGIYIPPPSDWF